MTAGGARLRPGRQADVGMTMIELLVTIVVMGIAFSVIVGGLGISILGSDVTRRRANTGTSLTNAAESVKSERYDDCAATYPMPAGVTLVSIGYWDPDSNQYEPPPCADDAGLQLVTVKVAPGRSLPDESLEVVKRRP